MTCNEVVLVDMRDGGAGRAGAAGRRYVLQDNMNEEEDEDDGERRKK